VTTVRLFRGVDAAELDRVRRSRVLRPAPHNRGNAATVDRSIAVIYATDRDDSGYVLEFDAPRWAVEEDQVFRGDYKFTRTFRPRRLAWSPVARADRSQE
jgi:hypothetical protein